VFTTMRRNRRTNKMKSELGQGVDHFKRAAALAAQETSSTVGPRFYAARDRMQPTATRAKDVASSGWGSTIATLGPLISAAAENAKAAGDSVRKTGKENAKATKKSAKASKKDSQKNAKKLQKRADKALGKKKSGTGSKLFKLALVGGAIGAGAAYFVRKRQTAQWDEYDPSGPVAATPAVTTTDVTVEPTTQTAQTTPATPANELFDADPGLVAGDGDQTTSALHSPKVAKLASGKSTEE
jgi:hypothetical protein